MTLVSASNSGASFPANSIFESSVPRSDAKTSACRWSRLPNGERLGGRGGRLQYEKDVSTPSVRRKRSVRARPAARTAGLLTVPCLAVTRITKSDWAELGNSLATAAAVRADSDPGSTNPPGDSLPCTPPPYSALSGNATKANAMIHHRFLTTKSAKRRTSLLAFGRLGRHRRARVELAQRTWDGCASHAGGRMGPKRDLADILADVKLFSHCSSRQRRAIARHAQIAKLPEGVDLIKDGEPGDA